MKGVGPQTALARRPSGTDSLIETLTPRLREILELVARGLTNDDIARVLSISPHTVRTHLTALFSHLEVTNRTEAAAAYIAYSAHPTHVSEVLRRPAIAVLPFAPLDDDPRLRTVATGLAQDLASLFARWCWFPVIASTSTMGARQQASTTAELGRLLGARFIVDGDLRVQEGTWRLGVRIDDAETGYCLWTERLDIPATGVFEAQDRICESIVAAAYPVIVSHAFAGQVLGRHPQDLQAWELAYEAMALYGSRDRNGNARARQYFAEALRREPSLVLAHFGLGLASYDELLNQWGSVPEATARLAAAAERCIELAPHAAEGWYLLARHAQSTGDHVRGMQPLETAIARNPSFAHAHALLAQVLQLAGRSDEALQRMQHAVRIGPRSFVAGLASLHFMRGEYPDALQAAERAMATNPRYTFAGVLASAAAWWQGDLERARTHHQQFKSLDPSFEASGFLRTFGTHVDAVERIVEALRALEN